MPIYEYICHACGEEFEALQKFSDAPLKSCQCGKKGTVERKVSLSAFHLQGGGWYKDKYGGSNGKPAPASGNGEGGGDGGGDGAKSEAKDSKSTGTGDSSAKEKTSGGDSKSSSQSGGKSKPEGGSGAST